MAALRASVATDVDYKVLADQYFEQAASALEDIESRDEQIEQLRAEVRSLQYAMQWQPDAKDVVAPDDVVPPTSVEDAVHAAMDRFESDIAFGESVPEGVRTVAADAGPPDKILSYLEVLAELARAQRLGNLGMKMTRWLLDRGVIASGESETVRKSPAEQQARTWGDSRGERRAFDLHLKPKEGTSPNQCVRIYFDYDYDLGKIIVAWVGRHP